MEGKKQAVTDALNALFGDSSVSKEETMKALEEVADDLQDKMAALQTDIDRESGGS